ncbi:unnamed protein product, partial [Prorocentrum cordatum]
MSLLERRLYFAARACGPCNAGGNLCFPLDGVTRLLAALAELDVDAACPSRLRRWEIAGGVADA